MNQRLNDFSSLRTHPYSIMLYLFLAGLTMIFVGLSAAFMYSRFTSHQPPIKIPFLFLLNTLVLYSSSLFLKEAEKKYKLDDTSGYQRMLLLTILATFLFMGLQYVGWEILKEENPKLFEGGNLSSYVYAISIIHVFHILGGLPFFLVFFYTAIMRMREPVTVLIYFSDPAKQLQLKLLTRYWHFLDYLWIYLMVFFWSNYIIQW